MRVCEVTNSSDATRLIAEAITYSIKEYYCLHFNEKVAYMFGNMFLHKKRYSKREFGLIKDHIEHFFGKIANVYHILDTNKQCVNIMQIAPSVQHPFHLLVSCGMGGRKMYVPEKDIPNRLELLVALPAYWSINQFDDIRWGWPFNCLKFLTNYPFIHDTWLGQGHIIRNDESFAPTTKQCGIWLEYPFSYPENALLCKISNHDTVCFLQMIPLYSEEISYKEKNGTEALENLFGEDFSMIVDPARRNYCVTQ